MSSLDSRFGQPDDWGLTPARHREIANELGDHIDCLQADEGGDAAREAEAKLADPSVRRKLSAAHIADQVVATLHRRPSRSEWRELAWLMFWFALVIYGDILAGWLLQLCPPQYGSMWEDFRGSAFAPWLAIAAWLVLGISRAGFFLTLGLGIRAAWQRGWGVLIARLLQYKLIHTAMVCTGLLATYNATKNLSGYGPVRRMDQIPLWLTPQLVGGLLLLATACCLLDRRTRQSPAWLACLLALCFLYPSAPARGHMVNVQQPWPTQLLREDDTYRYCGLITDSKERDAAIARYLNHNGQLPHNWSAENMFITYNEPAIDAPPLHASPYYFAFGADRHPANPKKPKLWLGEIRSKGPQFTVSPCIFPGSGLAWIAAPVPLMGLLGLLSMLFIMGRRGLLAAVLYSIITAIALYCSVLPFVMTQSLSQIVEFSPLAIAKGPLPGFEQILNFPVWEFNAGHMILGALLISAGIPWLLTGLFLRSDAAAALPDDDDADLATA